MLQSAIFVLLGQDALADMYEDSSHPPSGESSARQTPQPPPPPNKEVQATFAKQVAQAISNDDNASSVDTIEHHHPHHHVLPASQTAIVDHMEPQHPTAVPPIAGVPPLIGGYIPHTPSQAVNSNYENLVQSSKLQVSLDNKQKNDKFCYVMLYFFFYRLKLRNLYQQIKI